MGRVSLGVLAVLLALSAPVSAQVRPPSALVVSGEGTAEAAPDLARVELGAQIQRRTAAEAQGQVSEATQRIIAALGRLGIGRDRIETATISIVPVRTTQAGSVEIVGYQATHLLLVAVDRIDGVGAVIDAAVGAGANQLGGVSFTLRDPSRARAQALAAAVQDARAKAEIIARAAGVTLAGIVRIEEGGTGIEPRVMRANVLAAPTEVLPGNVRVRSAVTVTYRF